jgi:hypothetical protein
MSANQISLKHNKHRVHPCPNDKKLELLNLLVSKHSKMKTIIVTANSLESIKEAISDDNIIVINDDELSKSTELTCELLISYDLPSTATLYMTRLSKAKEMALILLDANEQKQLYPIETVLGRVIKQDIIQGFEYKEDQKLKIEQKPVQRTTKEDYLDTTKFDNKPKYDKKPFDKEKRDDKSDKWAKKDKTQNKYLGKDENGKAIFSGKSGDRNHRYDGTPRDKYDAPKKVGRKISIKALKPKTESESNS